MQARPLRREGKACGGRQTATAQTVHGQEEAMTESALRQAREALMDVGDGACNEGLKLRAIAAIDRALSAPKEGTT